jgi:hypothetical protein
MAERRFNVTASQTINLDQFFARQITVNNLLASWIWLRLGGTDIPNQSNCDLAVPPFTSQTLPVSATNQIAVGVGPALVTLGAAVAAGQVATITLYDQPQPGALGSINLNPSRLGQFVQQTFVAAQSYTIAFPVTQVLVSNYSKAWVYLAYGTLVIPTAATANAAIPPMSEKTLPCPPTTQFAFGLSANLVTTGQQVPAGIRIIATFYEYPTPTAIGTATLNPSAMGQFTQQTFTTAQSYTIAFPVTQVLVSNYSKAWVYLAYGTLVTPTAATANAVIPPMSEKSLPCLPNTQFAFGLSSNLVTTGQQVPTGIRIIATFYEYSTPTAIGTATLNPSAMGQSTSELITASRPLDPAFPVTQINFSNYLQQWLYATYNQFNRLLNPDLETWAAGVPVNWIWLPLGGGAIFADAGYRYTYSARITRGAGVGIEYLYQQVAVTPGETLTASWWYRTDGVNAPRYCVFDYTGGAFIVPDTALGVPIAWTPVRVAFTVPAGCVLLGIVVMEGAGNPAGAQAWFDTFCLQVTTTAANAQIAVPPLSEKSISTPPATHFDVVAGAQTVMIATNLPVTQAVATLYEYYTPVNLGVSPLSPGGFRYSEILHNNVAVAAGTAIDRNLSNFNWGRYSVKSEMAAASLIILIVDIWDWTTGTYVAQAASVPLVQNYNASVTFHAGKPIRLLYNMSGGPNFTLTDTLEAW